MNDKKPLVIGIVGTAGSGKSTAAKYITEKYDAQEFSFSSLLVEALKNFRSEITRKDLIWLMVTMKEKFGDDILTRVMKNKIKEAKSPVVVVSGLRLPSDYDFIRGFKKNKLIFITAPLELRWERVSKRGEKSDDNIPLEEFKKFSQEKTEVHIEEIGKKADFTISNDKDLEEFKKDINKVVDKILEENK